ncbi:MAG: ankyrin repeat domain-containing protein [Candidatus Omnitrophota bacterium]
MFIKSLYVILISVFLLTPSTALGAPTVFQLIREDNLDGLNSLIAGDPQVINSFEENEAGNKPIHAAARQCSVAMIDALLRAGAKVNAVNYYGQSPVHIAATNCPVEVLKYLVENGANIKMRTETDHFTPLHFAANRQDAADVIDYLLSQGLDIDAPTKLHNTTPLINAIKHGNRPMIEFFISRGADPKAGYVLTEAVQSGATTTDLFQYLIEKGANVNGGAALMTSISYGKLDFARLLVQYGADVNQDGVMSAAVSTGDIEFVKLLLEKGGDVNQGDRTPLMSAAQANYLRMAKFLLSNKADVNKATKYGNYTAVSLAIWQGHRDMALFLLKNGAKPDIFVHAGLGDVGSLKKYELKALIHSKDEVGRTPLYAAIIGQQKQAVKYLVEKGALVNDKTKIEFVTPLHTAVDTRNRDIVHFLLDRGADIRAKMSPSLYVRSGFTPLDIARENKDDFMIKLLEKYNSK